VGAGGGELLLLELVWLVEPQPASAAAEMTSPITMLVRPMAKPYGMARSRAGAFDTPGPATRVANRLMSYARAGVREPQGIQRLHREAAWLASAGQPCFRRSVGCTLDPGQIALGEPVERSRNDGCRFAGA
jgi:hypothetical protein